MEAVHKKADEVRDLINAHGAIIQLVPTEK